MDKLKDTITETCFSRAGGDIISGAVPNLRHRLLLEKSLEPLSSAVAGLKGRVPLDLVSMDIQEGLSLLGGILGDFNRPDVIDDIFSRFCIGK